MALLDRESFFRELSPLIDSLYNFAHWLTNRHEEAEDMVHDALSSLILKGNYQIPRSALRTYLFTVIRRTFIDRLRRGRYEVTSNGYPEDEGCLVDGVASEEIGGLSRGMVRRDLNKALASLPDEERSIILLADVEGFPMTEIGTIMDIPSGTVKSKLRRARFELRKRLKVYRDQPAKLERVQVR